MKILRINDKDFISVVELLATKGIGFEVQSKQQDKPIISLEEEYQEIKPPKISLKEACSKQCIVCGKKFYPVREDARFCSNSCRNHYNYVVKKEKKTEFNKDGLYTIQDISQKLNVNKSFVCAIMFVLNIEPKLGNYSRYYYNKDAYDAVKIRIKQIFENDRKITTVQNVDNLLTADEVAELLDISLFQTGTYLRCLLAKRYKLRQCLKPLYYDYDGIEALKKLLK